VDLFNYFDTFFEKHVQVRKDLHIEENFEESDPPFPKDAVLQVLRVIRVVLENCTNKHFYSSYEVNNLCARIPLTIIHICTVSFLLVPQYSVVTDFYQLLFHVDFWLFC